MHNTTLSHRVRPFVRTPRPPTRAPRPVYQVSLPRQRTRLPRPEPKPGLLDAALGHAGRTGQIISGCAGLFIALVMLAFLSVCCLFGFAAYTILSNF